ncbi:EthD domain-containing protein [Hypoxylon crocopeplum]|nr:EthD domain-containing protein [Hypoxylon crocopeplum]
MVYSILLFATRKPGTTPEQFKAYYEGVHMPLLREIAGPQFPLSHTRRYIHRSEGQAQDTTRNATTPAQVLLGSQADFDYDVIGELVFTDAAAFQTFMGLTHAPENAARVAADEEKFLDRSQLRVVALGATEVTKKE